MDTATRTNGGKRLAAAMMVISAVLAATAGTAPAQTALGRGHPHTVSGPWHSRRYFYIDVPHNTTRLVVRLWGGAGNANIHAKRHHPGPWTQHSTHAGNNEHISVGNPQAGRWFIMVHGATAYHHAHLVANYEVRHGPPVWHRAAAAAPIIIEHAMRHAADSDDDDDDDDEDDDDDRDEDSERSERSARSGPPVAGRIVTLRSGQWVNDLSGDANYDIYYRIIVPSGTERLVFLTEGGAGNCLLFVRRGALPTGILNDGLSDLPGTSQAVTIEEPVPGVYYVALAGDPEFARVSLRVECQDEAQEQADAEGGAEITPLENGAALTGLQGAAGSRRYFMIHLAAAQSRLSIQTRGGSGDCRLFVRRNALPTLEQFDHARAAGGTNHTMNFDENVQAGTYYIMIHTGSGYRSLSLVAEATPEE